jgi:hypothetical protein
MVEDRLSDEIIAGRIKDGQEVAIDAEGGTIVFRVQDQKVSEDGAAKVIS